MRATCIPRGTPRREEEMHVACQSPPHGHSDREKPWISAAKRLENFFRAPARHPEAITTTVASHNHKIAQIGGFTAEKPAFTGVVRPHPSGTTARRPEKPADVGAVAAVGASPFVPRQRIHAQQLAEFAIERCVVCGHFRGIFRGDHRWIRAWFNHRMNVRRPPG